MVGENRDDDRAVVGPASGNNKTPTLEEYGMNLTKLVEEVICYMIIWNLNELAFVCDIKHGEMPAYSRKS